MDLINDSQYVYYKANINIIIIMKKMSSNLNFGEQLNIKKLC
jgi:hypothetical protein